MNRPKPKAISLLDEILADPGRFQILEGVSRRVARGQENQCILGTARDEMIGLADAAMRTDVH